MTQENTNVQVLEFPYKLADTLADCDDVEIVSFQLRLHATIVINEIQSGRLKPRESLIQSLKNINDFFSEWGKPLLSLDFLNK
jgi:hypothetical protein